MLFSCDAHVIHAHTTLYLPFFYNQMFTSLDRLLPHRAGDYLALDPTQTLVSHSPSISWNRAA
jgi:hypothetical protein